MNRWTPWIALGATLGCASGRRSAPPAAELPEVVTLTIHGGTVTPTKPDGSAWDGDDRSAEAAPWLQRLSEPHSVAEAQEAIWALSRISTGWDRPDISGVAQLWLGEEAGASIPLVAIADAYRFIFPDPRGALIVPLGADPGARVQVTLHDQDGDDQEPIGVVEISSTMIADAYRNQSTYILHAAGQAGAEGQVLFLTFTAGPAATPGSPAPSPAAPRRSP